MTRVLFVCVKNAGKSQLAAGLLRRLLQDQPDTDITVASAGTHAGTTLNALSVEALAEVGIDVTDQTPHQLTDADLAAADLVVTLGDQAHVPTLPGRAHQTWHTDEPSRRGIDGMARMRLVRDDIARHVTALHEQLTGSGGSTPVH